MWHSQLSLFCFFPSCSICWSHQPHLPPTFEESGLLILSRLICGSVSWLAVDCHVWRLFTRNENDFVHHPPSPPPTTIENQYQQELQNRNFMPKKILVPKMLYKYFWSKQISGPKRFWVQDFFNQNKNIWNFLVVCKNMHTVKSEEKALLGRYGWLPRMSQLEWAYCRGCPRQVFRKGSI